VEQIGKNNKSYTLITYQNLSISISFFSDKELRVLDEIGLLGVLSYAQSGYLDRVILDLLKRRKREKSGKVGVGKVYSLIRGGCYGLVG
jgi:hypothetical protein